VVSPRGIKKRIEKALQERYAINAQNWNRYTRFFPAIDGSVKLMTNPVLGPTLKKMSALENPTKDFSQGYILTINRDLTYAKRSKNVVFPITMVQRVIKQSTYRVIMNRCFCRDGNKCREYPRDLGCIMLGEGTRVLAQRGVAREVTTKEALDQLGKAADMGLVAMCLWMEWEAAAMGISEEEHHDLLEICLCCPCCCLGLRNFKKMPSDVRQRFSSIGWKAASGKGCVSCGMCAASCPMGAISLGSDSITVSDECIGCGICASSCPQNAIHMVQSAPIKKEILDYFWGFRPNIRSAV